MGPKRVEGLIVETVGYELLVFDDASNQAAALNRAAAAVFELCDGTKDVDDIVAALADGELPVGTDGVTLALRELAEQGLIVDVPELRRIDRRALLARLGAGAAAAMTIPVVETLAVPTPAMAQSLTSAPTATPTALPTSLPTNLPTMTPTPVKKSAPTRLPTRLPTTMQPTPA